MGMQISSRWSMLNADDITVLEITELSVDIQGRFVPARVDYPFVVVILVVVTSNLLLC